MWFTECGSHVAVVASGSCADGQPLHWAPLEIRGTAPRALLFVWHSRGVAGRPRLVARGERDTQGLRHRSLLQACLGLAAWT